MITNPFLKK